MKRFLYVCIIVVLLYGFYQYVAENRDESVSAAQPCAEEGLVENDITKQITYGSENISVEETEEIAEADWNDLANPQMFPVDIEKEIEAYQSKYIALYTSDAQGDSMAFIRTEKEEVMLDDSGNIADVKKYYDASTDECFRYEVSLYGETMNTVINYYFCDHFIWVSRLQNHYGSWILSEQQNVFWSEVDNWVIEGGVTYRMYDNYELEEIEDSTECGEFDFLNSHFPEK